MTGPAAVADGLRSWAAGMYEVRRKRRWSCCPAGNSGFWRSCRRCPPGRLVSTVGATVILGVVVGLLVRWRIVRPVAAVVCVLFGLVLGATPLGDQVNLALTGHGGDGLVHDGDGGAIPACDRPASPGGCGPCGWPAVGLRKKGEMRPDLRPRPRASLGVAGPGAAFRLVRAEAAGFEPAMGLSPKPA